MWVEFWFPVSHVPLFLYGCKQWLYGQEIICCLPQAFSASNTTVTRCQVFTTENGKGFNKQANKKLKVGWDFFFFFFKDMFENPDETDVLLPKTIWDTVGKLEEGIFKKYLAKILNKLSVSVYYRLTLIRSTNIWCSRMLPVESVAGFLAKSVRR